MAEKKWSEMARIINPTDDTELCILDGNPLMNKRIKKVDFLKDSLSLTLKTQNYIIDTEDFFPPSTSQFPFLITPGSYGVTFTDPPIAGLNETNFNLKVDYVSHDGSGGNGGQDILQTLTTKDGVSYTRRLYHVGQQADMSATDFKMVGSGGSSSGGSSLIISATAPLNPKEGDKWITEFCEFTFLNNNWIEL